MNTVNSRRTTIQISLLIAVMLVLATTPIGYINLGVIRATTMHIPVIIATIVLGLKPGLMVSFVFGLTSIATATFNPVATSFLFSPFYSLGEIKGNVWSLFIAIVPRLMIAVVGFLSYKLVFKFTQKVSLAAAIGGFLASITNTILVLGCIVVFFGESYAQAINIPVDTLMFFIAGIIGSTGIAEAVVASVLTTMIAVPLIKMNNKG